MPPSAPSFCMCWGCKREPLCSRFEMASSQQRAVPLLFHGSTPAPLVLGGDAAFHQGGLTLAFQSLRPLAGRTAPEVGSFTLSALPHSCSVPPNLLLLPSLCWGEEPCRDWAGSRVSFVRKRRQRPSSCLGTGWDPPALAGRDGGALSAAPCSKPRWLDGTATSWLCSWLFSLCYLSSSPLFLPTSSPLSRPWFSLLSGLPLARLKPSRRDASCGKWSLRAAVEVLVHCWRRGWSPEARPGCSCDVVLLAWPSWREEGREDLALGRILAVLLLEARRCRWLCLSIPGQRQPAG